MDRPHVKTTRLKPPLPEWTSSPALDRQQRPASNVSTRSDPPSAQFFRAKDLKIKPNANIAYNPKLRPQRSQEFNRLKHRPSGEFKLKSVTPGVSHTAPSSPQVGITSPPLGSQPTIPSPRIANTNANNIITPVNVEKYKTQVARLDRKVMDLEISNTSLLAVNKYLEKRLRNKAQPGDDDEEDDEEEEEPDTSVSVRDLLISGGELDAEAIDEKADLIKDRMSSHISYLETSQQIESSLQNCLSLSTWLIDSANESINFSINPEDIRIGGKVVDKEDDE